MQVSVELCGQTLVAQEHDRGLAPQGSGMHFSGMVVTGPPMWCRQTNPGMHAAEPQSEVGQLAVSIDHAPFTHVAVVIGPSSAHLS